MKGERVMYASMTMVTAKPGMRERIEKVCDAMFPRIRDSKGCKSVTFLFDREAGECGNIALWESKEDAEAHLAVTGPLLQEALAGIVVGSPTGRIFEVYEPTFAGWPIMPAPAKARAES
jgi:quinol monooxygenase YgiN